MQVDATQMLDVKSILIFLPFAVYVKMVSIRLGEFYIFDYTIILRT